MATRKLRTLFIQPEWHRHYVPALMIYESIHGLILEAVAREYTDAMVFDRRFDTDENLMKVMQSYAPDIVAATAHTAGEIFNVMRLLTIVKTMRLQTITIVGGQHATLLPEDYFHPSVDLICIGPGEETFKETAATILKGGDLTKVPGLVVRRGGEYVVTPPRDLHSKFISWPPFDRKIIPRKYRMHYMNTMEYRPSIFTITTSGCPYRCKFCSLWAAARGTYRRRPPEEIVEDIASQPQSYVHVTDDNTFHNEDHAMEIYRLLKKRGIKKKIMAYARTDTICAKPDVLAKWREVGLGALVVGMEAVSDKHLTAMNKKSSVDVNVNAHRILDSLDIENWAHFVLMPEFQKEDFDAIWDFIDRLNISYPVLPLLTPMPGTPLFFEAKEQGKLTTFDYGFYNLEYMVMKTDLPKEIWYEHMMDLLKKVYAPSTLWRRRKSPSFHARPALGWAYRMNGVRRRVQSHIAEQLEMERTVRYEDVEHMLPPSLRRDYKPDKYYNAPTMANMKAFIEAGIDVPEDDDVLSQPALAAMGEPVVLLS